MSIVRFRQINKKLYRGGAPSPHDVAVINKLYGITKIISLDSDAGAVIDDICDRLNIEHHTIAIDAFNKSSILKLFSHNLDQIFLSDKPTYIHCQQGKDRTGLIFAIYRCKYEDWNCHKAYDEALSLGFGVGLTDKIIKFDKKIISKYCKHNHKHIDNLAADKEIQDDFNAAYDIVSNTNDYNSEYRDYTLDNWEQQSWSPYSDYRVREFPFDMVDKYFDEQYYSRQDNGLNDQINNDNESSIPQVGQYDVNTTMNGAGPSMVGSGVVY